jgi:hypothetical protein
MTLKMDKVIFQDKDIDEKPIPFYHKPEIYEYNDPDRGILNKIKWIEDEELKLTYAIQQRRELIKSELTMIYEAQDEYLKLQFEPVRAGVEAALNKSDYAKIMAILTSPYLPDNVKPITNQIYNKYMELING